MSGRERPFPLWLRPRGGPGATPPRHACGIATLAALATIIACESSPAPGEGAQQEGGEMAEPTPIEHITPEGVARLPVFTPAVRVGDLVFLSGAIGTPPSGELRVVEGGVGPETRATMDNIGRILEAAGLSFADLVKCTVFLAEKSPTTQR